MYTVIQIFCLFLAFIGVGTVVVKNATLADKILGTIVCIVSVLLTIYIQAVLK